MIAKLTPIRVIAVLLAAFLQLSAFSVESHAKKRAEEEFHKEFSWKDHDKLSVETSNGSIEVVGNDNKKIVVDAILSVTGLKEKKCQELLSEFTIKIEDKDGEIDIETKTPKKFRYSTSVSFKISLPSSMALECESTNGSLRVENISGKVNLETVNGAVNCSKLQGDVDIEAVNGGIHLDGASGNTDIEAVNGAIDCKFINEAPSKISLETVNGKISVEFESYPDANISAETINGSITISGEKIKKSNILGTTYEGAFLDGKGTYEFETVNGSITVNVPQK